MASLMEKDILLEYANIGHLLPNEESEEMKKDSELINEIYRKILISDAENLDFEKMLAKIKSIKMKYEKA